MGIGTATRSLAVGARVSHARAGLGAVAIMAIADARLGYMALRLLELGYKAPGVIDELVKGDPYAEYRQLGVIDADGFAAARTGKMNRDWAGHRVGDNFIVLGNYLTGAHLLDAMESTFTANPAEDLEERLLRTVEAGRDAGGQHGGQQSAALLVVDDRPFAYVDLRVDVHRSPSASCGGSSTPTAPPFPTTTCARSTRGCLRCRTGCATRIAEDRAQPSTLRSVGSRRSRSPSPSRFAPSTTRAIMSPGAVASHHAFDR